MTFTNKQIREALNPLKKFGECHVIFAKEAGMWHLSISHPTRYPTYDEIKEARYKFIPNEITMAMIFPPKEQFVNTHPNCFHLWEIKD